MKQGGKRKAFDGRLVMLGFGSIGQGILSLLQPELGIKPPLTEWTTLANKPIGLIVGETIFLAVVVLLLLRWT